MRSKTVLVLLAATVLSALWSAPIAGIRADEARAQTAPRAPREVFTSIEAAWREADARRLVRHFGRGRVSIGLPEVAPRGGHFSRSQSYYILKAHFETTMVQDFRFEHLRAAETDARVALALAVRRYRRRGDGRVIRDRVLVALQLEGDSWVISEIRALR